MSKKTIAFVTGGYSGEAVISYKSAITIENNIDTEKFNYYKIDINPVRIIIGSALFRLLVMIYISTLQFSVSVKGMNRVDQ